MSVSLEKGFIYASIVAALPLVVLDRTILGWRRFAWIGAVAFDGYYQLFLADDVTSGGGDSEFEVPEETEEQDIARVLQRLTVACICLVIVPHLVHLLQDMGYVLGLAALPPMGVALYLCMDTPVDSPEYWKLQAFLHAAVVFIPYLNHVPSGGSAPKGEMSGQEEEEEEKEGMEGKKVVDNKEATTNSEKSGAGKKKKTNKKKK